MNDYDNENSSNFLLQMNIMEQEDGEVSDLSDYDVSSLSIAEIAPTVLDIYDEEKMLDHQVCKQCCQDDKVSFKTDVNVCKKTAFEKLKNMSFSSKSKLPLRKGLHQQSPHHDSDEERRQRKRHWDERTNQQECHQTLVEERPRPLKEAVASADMIALSELITSDESAVRPADQPHTLRQRVETLISVKESEAISMSDKELRNLIARMFELDKEQQRLLQGRQTQFETLQGIYKEVKKDIENLLSIIPTHSRLDLPSLPQILQPLFNESSKSNGEAIPGLLEEEHTQQTNIPDPSQGVVLANARLSSGNDSEVNQHSKELRAGGRIRFDDVGNISSDLQKAENNGAIFGGLLNKRGIHEDLSRTEMRSIKIDGGSNIVNTTGRMQHVGTITEQTLCPVNGKRNQFPNLCAPTHVDRSSLVIPSTSTYDPNSEPFGRSDFAESNLQFAGGDSSYELFSKGNLPLQVDNFNSRSSVLLNLTNSASSSQTSYPTSCQMYDAFKQSVMSGQTVTQTDAISKLKFKKNDSGIQVIGQHSFAGSQSSNKFHLNKPPSPLPTSSNFPTSVSLCSTIDSVDGDKSLCNTYHKNLIHMNSSEVKSSSQVPLPNLSEPPPLYKPASVSVPAVLSNMMHMNILQNSLPARSVPASVSISPSNHASASHQLLPSASVTNSLTVLSETTASSNTHLKSSNAAVIVASLLLNSRPTTVTVPPPNFSVPPPIAPSLKARTEPNLVHHIEPTSSGDSKPGISTIAPVPKNLTEIKTEVLRNNPGFTSILSMCVPPPSFSVPPPRPLNTGPNFSNPPPMPSAGMVSRPLSLNLRPMTTPPPNLISGSVNLNCPPPDMSQPPPNIRNVRIGSSTEGIQRMVTPMIGLPSVSNQPPTEVISKSVINVQSRIGEVRFHHDVSINQRLSMNMENILNKLRLPAVAGLPRPLSSVGRLPPPLMFSPGIRTNPISRISSFSKRKGPQVRSLTTRVEQCQKRQISDMVAIIPEEHDHPSSHGDPDDNIFLIVSDEEDANK
ncbi:unnamed protein product [Thelazia callipaeda]|uniref:Pericentriolar material 1 protein n=1 Tax=Thelazia callipaeda TaxID=103827 RepID=A0A0N5CU46_THECL|nr:unnamed protein product [Thelazia callipaeda]